MARSIVKGRNTATAPVPHTLRELTLKREEPAQLF